MTGMEPALIASLAGTAVSAVGAIQQGNAAKAAADYNAQIAERNAVIARQQGAAAAAKQEREGRIRMGMARASAGGSGVTLDSFGDLLQDSAKQEELDRLTILYNADLQAQSGELSAAGERASGAAAQKAGYIGAAGSLLKGGASAYSKMGSTTPATTPRVYGMSPGAMGGKLSSTPTSKLRIVGLGGR